MSSQQPPDFVIESLKDLKQSFAGLPVERQRVRTSSYVIGFGVDSSALLVEHTDALAPFITTLRDYPDSAVVSVVGRASQTGPEASNRQLARDRADRVRAYLIASGVPEERVGPVVFHGSDEPLVDLPGREDEMNRSVELVIEWVDLDFESGFTPGGTTEWQLDLTVTFGGARADIGGQVQIGTLTNRDTGASKTVTAIILGLDMGASLFVTAAADVGLPFGNGGVFSMPDPPGPVDFDWFDGRFIVLASIGASAIVGGVDFAALRFYNADGPWPEASFADYPIGVTLGVGGVAMIGYFNVDL
jgi:outer membrane protein OmpA-like peptidoglycan-associated protein